MMVLKFYGITRVGDGIDVSRIGNLSNELKDKLTNQSPVLVTKVKDTGELMFCVVARSAADATDKYNKYMEESSRKLRFLDKRLGGNKK